MSESAEIKPAYTIEGDTNPEARGGPGSVVKAHLTFQDGRIESFWVDRKSMRIRDPGKFEHEALYVPYFWDLGLFGAADEDNGELFGFMITPEDIKRFPGILAPCDFGAWLVLEENDQGFVTCGLATKREKDIIFAT